ncbi:MAG: ShlB/FhaC/HecB family hemolysin secretion/activation protein [Cyanobacteria bacterium J06598_1]
MAQPATLPPEVELEDILPRSSTIELPDAFPPEELPELDLPPSEESDAPLFDLPSSPAEQFRIGEIVLLGMTLSPGQLQVSHNGEIQTVEALVANLEGQLVTLEDLLALRGLITEAYIKAGYITSGAFIPEQDFEEGGAVSIQIVEGALEQIEIAGLSKLRSGYVRSRIRAHTARPLNQADIEKALQLLQIDPLIETVNAQLLPGSGAGQSVLLLTLEEVSPWRAGISANNYRSPLVGSAQLTPYVGYDNVLGVGDRLDLTYSLTEGLNSYSLRYSVPVNAYDGTLTVSLANGQNRIVEDKFDDLEAAGSSSSYSVGFRQPLVRSPNQEFALGLAFDLQRSESTIAGGELSFPSSNVSALRFSQDWVDRTPKRVLAARSQFNLGLDIFDATRSDITPDGQFFSWQGQFQWVQQLPKNQLLLTRVSSQLTPDALLSLEQFSLGGINTVRGYRENQLLRDNGLAASVEMRFPLLAQPDVLQIAPFIEGGVGWNSGEPSSVDSLLSVGTGLLWQIDSRTKLRLDYGYALTDVDTDRNSLQENGFSFSLDWAL